VAIIIQKKLMSFHLVLCFGKLLLENLHIEVIIDIVNEIKTILLDINGVQVSIEVVQNDLRPNIPKKTPEMFQRLMRKCWVIFNF